VSDSIRVETHYRRPGTEILARSCAGMLLCAERLRSAWRRDTSFASPKEVSKKRRPLRRRPATRGSLVREVVRGRPETCLVRCAPEPSDIQAGHPRARPRERGVVEGGGL